MKPIAKYYGTLYLEIAEPVPSISGNLRKAKLKKQNDRAKGKIPNAKPETLNNVKKRSVISSQRLAGG